MSVILAGCAALAACANHALNCSAQVVLHPLLVHITFNLAQTLQDYFNLREPEECVPCRDAAGNAPSASAQEGAGLGKQGV
eukprot:1159520-Pelagomonas_calceolata.AAC.1